MARTHGHGNPDWTRDEVILALELYQQCDGKLPGSDDTRVVALSSLLRGLPYHLAAARKVSFRNPAGVAFKLQNLRQVAVGKGLGNTSKVDREIWEEFGSHPQKIKELSRLIRNGATLADEVEREDIEDEDQEFSEGRLLTDTHKRRERNRGIRKKLLGARRKKGLLKCDLCGMKGFPKDHPYEEAVFEAHHRIPISMAIKSKVKLSEMALLCAICHRLVHRTIAREKRWVDLEECGKILGIQKIWV